MHKNVCKPNRDSYDIAIIGGGINGTAIARDMAGRGYSVILFDMDDLGAHTSSASTKLIHGGLRYLEYGELRLVKKALLEREVFLNTAPHIVRPLRFVLPRLPGTRPGWMIRLGLRLYDGLAHRDILPSSQRLDLSRHEFGNPFAGRIADGFAYSDCAVDDARLVVLQALDAARNGACILTRTKVRDITPFDGMWDIETETGLRIRARMCINASGPWVRQILDGNDLTTARTPAIRLIRGSHIVVPRLYEGDQAYMLQQPDKRVVFTIPYERDFTLIGTTDVEHGHNPDVTPAITDAETAYLCDAINRAFVTAIAPDDVRWSYSGLRPLFDTGGNATSVTRDYHLYMQTHARAPILSVYGGKITTCRELAENAAGLIEERLGKKGARWTHDTPLPGGNVVERDMFEFIGDMMAYYPWMDSRNLERMAHAYGTHIMYILGGAQDAGMLGHHFGGGLYQAEIDYLIRYEWAQTAEDIMWRRTKLGLHTDETVFNAVSDYMRRAT